MIDKDTLLEMIKEQEQVVQKAKEQLVKLYALATQMGITVKHNFTTDFPQQQTSIKSEIEAKRKEMFEKVEKMRQEAIAQAQQSISAVQTTMPQIPKTNGFQDIKSFMNPEFIKQYNPGMLKNIKHMQNFKDKGEKDE